MDILTSNSALLLEKSVGFLWTKQAAILDNIANAETPNYKTKVVTFEESIRSRLERAAASPGEAEESVRDILEAPDQTGAPLLKIENGQLLRSARPTLLTLGYEVDDTSIQAESQSDSAAAFLFQETGLDGSLYRTRLSMTKTAGGWPPRNFWHLS